MPGGGASKTAKWLKWPAVQPDDLSLVLSTYIVEGANFWNFSSGFWYLHAPHTFNFFKKLKQYHEGMDIIEITLFFLQTTSVEYY